MRRRTRELYQLAEQNGIEVYHDLDPRDGVLGFYCHDYLEDGSDLVYISFQVELETRDKKLFRSVFAEELGHHFTSSGCYVFKESRADVVNGWRQEHRAWRWAVEYMIGVNSLISQLRHHEFDLSNTDVLVAELSDYYFVIPEFVEFRLRLFLDRQAAEVPLKFG